MALRVVGVGLGRTGTNSLKLALEQLLDAPCHHMLEVFQHPEQVPLWTKAAEGEPDWPATFDGYAATVDWPGAAFWRELVAEYPDAVVLLSKRESADAWWRSANRTIFEAFNGTTTPPPPMAAWFETLRALFAEAGIDPTDESSAKVGYERHLEAVRAEVPAERLVEWTTGDGWGPLCAALGKAVPDVPFPHVNTTDEFRARFDERVSSGGPEAEGSPLPAADS
ncbi:MAG: sulfotransferase family protein [Acidimicrobiales bacterium]